LARIVRRADTAVSPTWHIAGAVGVIAGVVYTLSPTTLWFLAILPALFAWAQRGLAGRERRWVIGLFGVAVVARLIALWGFFLSVDHHKQAYGILIGDEWFMQLRASRLLQVALGREIFPTDYESVFGEYGRSGVQVLFASWEYWFGPAPYGTHLLNVTMWLTGSIALYRTARRAFGPPAALAGFALVLFMPSMFAWSISALKEPAHFLLTAITIAGVMTLRQPPQGATRVTAVLLVICAIAALATLRTFAVTVAVGGLALAVTGWALTRRAAVTVAALTLLVVAGTWMMRRPDVQDELMRQMRRAAVTHLGNVNTPGYSYRLLEPHFYTRTADFRLSYMIPWDAGRFALRALLSFVVVPLPWRAQSMSALVLMPEQLTWYLLVVLVVAGAAVGWRRDPFFTWVLVSFGVVGGGIVALYSGNVGTLVRMRDTVVPIVAWLGTLGGVAMLDAAARRRGVRV